MLSRLLHKLLEDDERAKSIIAGVGLIGGSVLLAVAVSATILLK